MYISSFNHPILSIDLTYLALVFNSGSSWILFIGLIIQNQLSAASGDVNFGIYNCHMIIPGSPTFLFKDTVFDFLGLFN